MPPSRDGVDNAGQRGGQSCLLLFGYQWRLSGSVRSLFPPLPEQGTDGTA